MGKHVTGHRPNVHAHHTKHTVREEYRLCKGDECQNIIAVRFKEALCSRCRRGKGRRQ